MVWGYAVLTAQIGADPYQQQAWQGQGKQHHRLEVCRENALAQIP